MRLTLRALLAWMDENLPAEDAAIIAQKVAESELATGLKNQIQTVLAIPFLPASIVLDSTPMGDPNTAAEYLDNFMPTDDVVEYEKHCIHSDVVLAEVASCHQILTMVLGEPAEVNAEVRRRIYDMHDKYFTVYEDEAAAKSVANVMNELTHGISSAAMQAEEPKKGSFMKLILRALVLAALLLLAFWGVGRFYPESQVGQLAIKMLPFGPAATEDPGGVEKGGPVETPEAVKHVEPVKPDNVTPVKTVDPVKPEDVTPVKPADQGKPEAEKPVKPDVVPEGELTADTGEADTTEPRFDPAAAGIAVTGPETGAVAPVKPGTPGGVTGEEEPAGVAVVRPGTLTGEPTVEVPVRTGTEPAGDVPVTGPGTGAVNGAGGGESPIIRVRPPKRVGRLESQATQVLAEFNSREGAWGRLASQAGVMTGSRLVSFNGFRPVVSVADQVDVTFVGAAELRVEQAESGETPVLAVEYGRFLFETFEDEDNDFPGTVLATFPGYSGRLCFAQENTCVAVEVHRAKRFTVPPESLGVPVNINVHVIRGTVVVQPYVGAEPVAIAAGSFVRLANSQLDPVLRAAPVWVEPVEMEAAQQVAVDTMAKVLNVGGRLERELMELTEDRNKDVTWLATRNLGQLGNFSRMVSALNKPEESKNWGKYVDELREAMVRGAGQSADVQRGFDLYSPQAKRAYRLLWAFQPPKMSHADALDLLTALNEEDISARILANWNLQRFFKGDKPINYKPEQPASQRAAGIQRWREFVESNPEIFVDN